VELFPSAIHLLSLMVRLQTAAVMEQLTLFLLSSVPAPPGQQQEKASASSGAATTRRRGMTGMTQSDQDVMRIVSLRNMLLEMLHAEIIHSTSSYEMLITPEWLSNWMHRHLHSSSRLIGLRIVCTMLSCCPSFARGFQRTGWKWLLETISTFHLQGEVVYLLLAIVYGQPASSVPTKVRADMCDLHTLFPPDKSPVVNAEAFACVLSMLKSASEIVYDKLTNRGAPTQTISSFIPIKSRDSRSSGSDSDDDGDRQAQQRQQQQQRAVSPKAVPQVARGSAENLLDRSFDRQPDLAALGVLCRYMLQAMETSESFRNLCGSDIVVDRLVCLLFIRSNVNVYLGAGIISASASSLSRDKVTFAGLHKIGKDEMQLLSCIVHYWIRNDAKGDQKAMDLLAYVPPDVSPLEANFFTSSVVVEILLKLKQNVTLKV
jgi:hypothetical protein